MIAMVLGWTGILYMGAVILWSTSTPYPRDDTVAAAGIGVSVLASVLISEAPVWLKRSQTDRAGRG